MAHRSLQSAIDSVPAGAWAVGVSGGADSIALLSLLRDRADLQLTIVHLDHETRAGASAADAEFVRDLCNAWQIPCVIATLSSVEPELPRQPKNVSSRWRLARLALYRRVVQSRGLRGVILAHHADDQAETIFHRLVRGSGSAGLGGMAGQTTLSGLAVLRPLLDVPREALRSYLALQRQDWREDASNASPRYARNRIRRLLTARPELSEPLLELGRDCRRVKDWLDAHAPRLGDSFALTDVRALPPPIARRSLLRWLRQRSPVSVEPASAERLLEMVLDAASPARQHFPGNLLVCRRRGQIVIA